MPSAGRPEDETLRELGLEFAAADAVGGEWFLSRGCDGCRGTGYRGRTGIYELLSVDDTIRRLIMQQANASMLRSAAIERGMRPLLQDGARKVLEGRTTAEEVLRVTQDND